VGLDANGCRFLLYARRLGADFSETLTLGRQGVHLAPPELERALAEFGVPAGAGGAAALIEQRDGYAEGLLRHLGAREVASMDASSYEGATLVHDLNLPVPPMLHERFTAVIDGGTLEHVFDVAAALRSCMAMLRPGGHFLAVAPSNNLMGHGFYQFSPELYFRAFSEENGFRLVRLIAFDAATERWYRVRDPLEAGRRVGVVGRAPTQLLVLARRLRSVPPLLEAPVQADYRAAWGEPPRRRSAFRAPADWLHRRLPRPLRLLAKRALDRLRPLSPRYDPELFEPIDDPASEEWAP